MKRAIFFVALSAIALSLSIGCGGGSSPDPNQNGGGGGGRKLVYTATVDGGTDIYAMNPDGSGQVRVTTDGIEKSHLALSPDGSKVAYLVRESFEPPTYKLAIQSVAGGAPQILSTELDIPGGPRWMPSGSGLVISSYLSTKSGAVTTRRSAILRVGLDGSSQVIKPSGASLPAGENLPGFHPDVSPNGGKIAFTGVSGGSFNIWTMDIDGGNPQKIEATNWQSEPRFSPDGKQIVFRQAKSSGTGQDIYIAASDGSGARGLVASLSANNSPALPSWSPDGKRIVYVLSGGFFSIKTDGTDNTQLFPNLGGPATLGEINWK